MLQNIPPELRARPQWVTAHDDKIPRNPRTGQNADPTDPRTWGTFEEAVRCGMKHVGYVLAADDPYSAIDLDAPVTDEQRDRHTQILEAAESYAEVSQSGNGVHIFVKGKIPNGVRRDKVEVYSDGRYMIMTGNVLNHLPIAERQPLLDVLYREMATTGRANLEERDETITDEDLWQMAHDAVNGLKFDQLWDGDWQRDYPSQSEADFALMAMLCFYSKSNEQCRRVFRMSALGKRDKADRVKYLDYMIAKCRSHEPPPVDLENLKKLAAQAMDPQQNGGLVYGQFEDFTGVDATKDPYETKPKPKPPQPVTVVERTKPTPPDPNRKPLEFPPGLVGELASYIQASAIRPVREISLAGALALTSGVAARSYNISGTGLNQYLVLLARTGSGKEGIATGIDALVAALRPQIPMVDRFIGPAAFASGQALVRVLDEQPCFVSILGEVGTFFEQLADPKAPAPVALLRKALLDIYNKSGWNKVLRPSVYADSEKNTKIVQAPNVTILGESTPEEFYRKLDMRMINNGLLPRFSVIEYLGPRPHRNPNAFQPPDQVVVDRLGDLVTVALTTRQNNTCCPVQIDSTAQRLLDELDKHATNQINKSGELEKELWNRTHLKALKLSALLAVGCDPQQPVVTGELAEWARQFVTRDVELISAKFRTGDVGEGQSKQEVDLYTAIKDYLRMKPDARRSYRVPEKLLEQPLVPYHYLRRRLRNVVSFKDDRRGFGDALEDMLAAMVKAEQLVLVDRRTSAELEVTQPVYAVGPTFGGNLSP